MNRLRLLLTLVAACITLAGCAPKEPPVKEKTVSEIDAQIKEIEANTNMPAGPKGMALGSLKKQRELAVKREGGK